MPSSKKLIQQTTDQVAGFRKQHKIEIANRITDYAIVYFFYQIPNQTITVSDSLTMLFTVCKLSPFFSSSSHQLVKFICFPQQYLDLTNNNRIKIITIV
ncbi:hypothetical protein Hanom_Chr06g00521501 [Helianthus anomalus]